MSKKKNVFTDEFKKFMEQCTDFVHLLHFQEWQTKQSRKSVEGALQHFQAKKWDIEAYFAATASSVVNVFDEGEFVMRSPVSSRSTRGKDMLALMDEIEGRYNATILVSLHECLEKFLMGLYGDMLYYLRNSKTLSRKKDFHKKEPKAVPKEGTLEYYRSYAEWICSRNCDAVLREFAKILDWDSATITGWGDMDWITLAKTVGFARHCIVHSEGRPGEDQLKKLAKEQRSFVMAMVKKSHLTGEQRLLPDRKFMDDLYESIQTFAYALYVLLSRKCQMKQDIDYFKGRPSERKG